MKIAIRAGHNMLAKGAQGLLKEEVEALKVKESVIKYLKAAGHNVLDVTPGPCSVNDDLRFGVNKANNAKVDLFASIHFNKAYDSYNGAIGSEAWTIGPGKATDTAKRIVDALASSGFKNRGVKHRGLYELKNTNMSAIIVEVCFVEATEDVRLYSKLGSDAIGKNIAEGINGVKIELQDALGGDVLYRVKVDGVQIGAYKQPDNVVKQLKDNWGEVQKIEIERR